MKPKFISSTDSNAKYAMYLKSSSNIIMTGSNIDEIIQEVFDLLIHRCQTGLEQFMKGSNFIFDYVLEMDYLCHKVSINGGWIIHSFS